MKPHLLTHVYSKLKISRASKRILLKEQSQFFKKLLSFEHILILYLIATNSMLGFYVMDFGQKNFFFCPSSFRFSIIK